MSATNTCRCGKPTRDAAYVCDDCAHSLSVALGEIPWLAGELETTIGRTKGVDYRTSGAVRGSESPSPVVWGPSEARTHLRAVLVAWALFSSQESVRNSAPCSCVRRHASPSRRRRGDQGDPRMTCMQHGLPEDNLIALSRWLMWRVDGLTLLDIGPEAVDEITGAAAHCRRLIDRPPDRQYLGKCGMCESVGTDGRLYGRPGSRFAACDTCGDTVNAETLRTKLIASLEDRLCTAAEIAKLSTYLGLKADRERVRKRINQWAARGLLTEASSISDEPTFRFGTVYEMLVTDEYGRRSGRVA